MAILLNELAISACPLNLNNFHICLNTMENQICTILGGGFIGRHLFEIDKEKTRGIITTRNTPG